MRLFPKRTSLTVFVNDGSKTEAADLSPYDYNFTVTAKLPEKKNKKNRTNPVNAVVEVMGLNEATREKIEASKAGIKIEYGYGEDVFELFEGEIVNAVSDYMAPGWRTTIYAKHAWDAYKNSFFSKSYESDVPIKTVLEDVLKSFGLPYTNRYNRTDSLIGGGVYHGFAKDILDGLCADYDTNWAVENNSIVLNDTLNPPLVNRSKVVILGPSVTAGPTVEETLQDENKKNEKVVRRISATSVLLPELWPGVPVRFDVKSFGRSFGAIDSRSLRKFDSDSIYICDTVTHRGSSMATECTTDVSTKEETL